jgi:hypothetical protein
MRQRTIGGQVIVAMKPSQRLPPLRLERAPRDEAELEQLRLRCLQIVFRLQGNLLTWKQVQTRAQGMEREALKEANRKVREPTRAMSVLAKPGPDGLARSKGGILLPSGGSLIVSPHGR